MSNLYAITVDQVVMRTLARAGRHPGRTAFHSLDWSHKVIAEIPNMTPAKV